MGTMPRAVKERLRNDLAETRTRRRVHAKKLLGLMKDVQEARRDTLDNLRATLDRLKGSDQEIRTATDTRQPSDVGMKDVFISHSWGDKKSFVEPLTVAIESAGLTCWYDIIEVRPGDNLVDRINDGLTHSKVVLFCLSENVLAGNGSNKELQAVVGLSTLGTVLVRMIPLMLCDPRRIQERYSIPFAGMSYIRWDGSPANVDDIIDKIRRVVSEVDATAQEYWWQTAADAYRREDYVKAALYARKTLEFEPNSLSVYVCLLASLLRLGRSMDAYHVIAEHEHSLSTLNDDTVDLRTLDFVQDQISSDVTGTEIDKLDSPLGSRHCCSGNPIASDHGGTRCAYSIARRSDRIGAISFTTPRMLGRSTDSSTSKTLTCALLTKKYARSSLTYCTPWQTNSRTVVERQWT